MRMNWDYIAGFFDGEGHISIAKARDREDGYGGAGNFSVGMTQATERGRELLEEIASFLGEHQIEAHVYLKRKESPKRKRAYFVIIQQRDSVRLFLWHVKHRLRMKRTLAEDAWRFTTIYTNLWGLAGNKHDHIETSDLAKDRAAGMTYREIGAKYGVGETFAWDRLNRAQRNHTRKSRKAAAA